MEGIAEEVQRIFFGFPTVTGDQILVIGHINHQTGEKHIVNAVFVRVAVERAVLLDRNSNRGCLLNKHVQVFVSCVAQSFLDFSIGHFVEVNDAMFGTITTISFADFPELKRFSSNAKVIEEFIILKATNVPFFGAINGKLVFRRTAIDIRESANPGFPTAKASSM